jgi:hypothetical protein
MRKVHFQYLPKVVEALDEAGRALHVNPGVPGVYPTDLIEAGKALRKAASALRSHAAELEDTLNDED